MKGKEIYALRDNFLLVKERESRKGLSEGRCVIRTSGYTNTVEGVMQNWLLTQLQTLPKEDRSYLPDPVIIPQTVSPMKELDCSVFTLYFLPECKGLKYAMEEFSWFLEAKFRYRCRRYALIGHSKGGLFVGGLASYLDKTTNIILITPTFGTIMGDERMVYEKLDGYRNEKTSQFKKLMVTPEVEAFKRITHLIGSRRPIDYDMAIGSALLEELNLSELTRHRTLLITGECPKECGNISEAFFKHYGKLLGLDKEADGMVSLENQRLAAPYVDKVIPIKATHPTILNEIATRECIRRFLLNM